MKPLLQAVLNASHGGTNGFFAKGHHHGTVIIHQPNDSFLRFPIRPKETLTTFNEDLNSF